MKTQPNKAASLFEIRTITITCPTMLEINLDPVQFEQLLIKLIKNAHEYLCAHFCGSSDGQAMRLFGAKCWYRKRCRVNRL